MKRKIIFSAALLIGLMSAFVLFSAAKREATDSESGPCTQTESDCCQRETDTGSGNSLDIESLSGKFFSSVLIR